MATTITTKDMATRVDTETRVDTVVDTATKVATVIQEDMETMVDTETRAVTVVKADWLAIYLVLVRACLAGITRDHMALMDLVVAVGSAHSSQVIQETTEVTMAKTTVVTTVETMVGTTAETDVTVTTTITHGVMVLETRTTEATAVTTTREAKVADGKLMLSVFWVSEIKKLVRAPGVSFSYFLMLWRNSL